MQESPAVVPTRLQRAHWFKNLQVNPTGTHAGGKSSVQKQLIKYI